jgi:hypothetical protein
MTYRFKVAEWFGSRFDAIDKILDVRFLMAIPFVLPEHFASLSVSYPSIVPNQQISSIAEDCGTLWLS